MAIPRNLANFAPKLDSSGNPTFTAPTVFSAGTVSLPSITFTGDTNTGIFSPTADTIAFSEGGVEAMRLDAVGRLLIGTNTSLDQNANLQVASTGYYVFNGFQFSNDAFATTLSLKKSRGATVGTNTIVQNGDTIGTISFFGANGTGYNSAALINAEIDGTPGASNDMPGRLIFSTTADGAGSPTERMRINSSGTVILQGGSTSATGVGITFPATQSESSNGNTLDDYEEGTWSPNASGFTVSGTTTLTRTYTKIGRLVFFDIKFANTGTIAWAIYCKISIPFVPATTNCGLGGMYLADSTALQTAGTNGVQIYFDSPDNAIYPGQFTTTSSGQTLIFSGFYRV